jgi:hypothetical protein
MMEGDHLLETQPAARSALAEQILKLVTVYRIHIGLMSANQYSKRVRFGL